MCWRQNTKIPSLVELAFHQVEVDTKKRIKSLEHEDNSDTKKNKIRRGGQEISGQGERVKRGRNFKFSSQGSPEKEGLISEQRPEGGKRVR